MSTVRVIEFQVGIGLDMFSMDYVTHIVHQRDHVFPVEHLMRHKILLNHYGTGNFARKSLSFIRSNRHKKENEKM